MTLGFREESLSKTQHQSETRWWRSSVADTGSLGAVSQKRGGAEMEKVEGSGPYSLPWPLDR